MTIAEIMAAEHELCSATGAVSPRSHACCGCRACRAHRHRAPRARLGAGARGRRRTTGWTASPRALSPISPPVVEVHVSLRDNSLLRCGNPKLGDGDNPDTNLYWATTPAFGEWFARRGSGWTRIAN